MCTLNPGSLNPDRRQPNLPQAPPSKRIRLSGIGRRSGIRSASLVFAAITCFLVWGSPTQAQTDPDSNTRVTVLVYNFVGVPPGVLQAAERQAEMILEPAGAKVDWVPCPNETSPDSQEPCRSGWSTQTPGLRIIAGASKFQGPQFGSTAIPIYSTIYYDRVTARAHRDHTDADLSVMLGCVIAHELGHLLLRSPGHDARGIMQAQWGSAQLRQALTGHLLFTQEQAIRIQSQARILASIPRTTQPAITP
jgi:hypothetical protein